MAEGKKSVVLYVDLIHTFEQLTDSQAGKLIKHFLKYVNDQNPKAPDKLTQIVFEPIKQQLKRDLIKWEVERGERSKAGKLGGIKSGESRRNKANEASASKSKQNKANEAANANANVTVSVNESVIYNAEAAILKDQLFLENQCMKTGRQLDDLKEILHTYHLYLEEKEQYPRGKKSVFAGFEKWLINEKKFNNGSKNNSVSNRHTGAAQLIAIMRKDHAGGK